MNKEQAWIMLKKEFEDAVIRKNRREPDGMWQAIQKGLQYNYRNYKLYLMFGDHGLPPNLYQAYLCYENALFHCDVQEDRTVIEGLLKELEVPD